MVPVYIDIVVCDVRHWYTVAGIPGKGELGSDALPTAASKNRAQLRL